MKTLIFSLLLLAVLAKNIKVFRYEHGNLTIGRELPRKISGTFLTQTEGNVSILFFMGTEKQTMVPFSIIGQKVDNSSSQVFSCLRGIWRNREKIAMTGRITIESVKAGTRVTGSCFSLDSKMVWVLEGQGERDESFFYDPEDAGLRAASLVSQSNSLYNAHEVIGYAIADMPFFAKSCSGILKNFPIEEDDDPGMIIVGTDGKHCGIIDSEGYKFIHANPAKKVVTLTSLELAGQFFPKGYEFRGYPKVDMLINY
eukprot:TRINITY_DN1078_c0_g1_i6.p1 TRINITY_DN1078_c0_g1~~TRINITY_DN1078_c0_g1_i6.p1  ORF type:complete len:287 (-),score=67.59 TRINITY_DN1078_c0_g1_i6:103-870(-)